MPALDASSAVNMDITAYAGDTFEAVMTFTDSLHAPIIMTGIDLKMQIKSKFNGPVLEELAVGDGITIASNVVTFRKDLDVKGGTYVYDLQATYPGGDIITYLFGKFIIIQDITDAIT